MGQHNANEQQGKTFEVDGGADLRYHCGLSGEPQAAQIIVSKDGTELTASGVFALNVAKREYQKLYMDYWNSTAALTGTGRPVDGFFCPLAPHAAVIPTQYEYVTYTGFVNLLDYTSLAVPVTFADTKIDVHSAGALEEDSGYIQWDCK